jgi:hypothetical protein
MAFGSLREFVFNIYADAFNLDQDHARFTIVCLLKAQQFIAYFIIIDIFYAHIMHE